MSVAKDVVEMLSRMHKIEREAAGSLGFGALHLVEFEGLLLRCSAPTP